MICKTIHQLDCDTGCDPSLVTVLDNGKRVILVGTVIDAASVPTADCVKLVRNGLAIPIDEECRAAAQRTDAQLTAAQIAMQKMLAIPPENDDEDNDDEEDE